MKYDNNELIVRVWNPANHSYQPRGKQFIDIQKNNSIYYIPCSGIWGTVWLEQVPYVYMDHLLFQNQINKIINI